MKNKIEDLRNHLFAQLEKLSDENIDIDKECKRTELMINISEALLNTGKLEIEFLDKTSGNAANGTGFFPVAKEQRKYFIEKEGAS